MSNGKRPRGDKSPFSRLQGAYKEVVNVLMTDDFGYNTDIDRANFDGTPKRVAKAMHEMIWPWERIQKEVQKCFKTFPTGGLGSIVDQHDIIVSVICPHHLMPAIMRVSVCYMPGNARDFGSTEGEVLGISKLARIATVLSKRPVLQETYVRDLADVLCDRGVEAIGYRRTESMRELPQLPSAGSAVRADALHTCMACRGVESPVITTGTTALRGEMFNAGAEFYRMIDLSRSRKLFGA